MSDLELRRIVYGLLQAGLVRIVRPPGLAPPKGSPARRKLKGREADKQRSVVNRLIKRIRSLS